MKQTHTKQVEEVIKEIEELQLLDNFITMNPMESSDESFEKVRKLPILELILKGTQMSIKSELRFLEKLHKILNTYHSQIPGIEIGRQNVLNDVDNELELDNKITDCKNALAKIKEVLV